MGSLALVIVEFGLLPALLFFSAVCLYVGEQGSAVWGILICMAARFAVQVLCGNSPIISGERHSRQAVELQRTKLRTQRLSTDHSRLLEAVNECLQRDSDSSGTQMQLQRAIERMGREMEELSRAQRSLQHRQSVQEQRMSEDDDNDGLEPGRIM